MFIPHTNEEREDMLRDIGVKNIEDLFCDVPKDYRFPKLDLPEPLTEMEAVTHLQELAMANESTRELVCFLGAGAYNHYIPAAVDSLLRRGEFYTAYTPYQPEVSQGTLQAIFEYQSLISALTGMDVCNASHYDGASATAEAGIMAYHHFKGKRTKYVLSPSINPQYRDTFRTYLGGNESLQIVGDQGSNPLLTPDELAAQIDGETALVMVQYPDFFGRIFSLSQLAEKAHAAGALFGVVVNPIALGLLTPPGEFGADIVVGEGQPLGIPLSYGGPYLGIFATKQEYIRKIAGRLVGETVDTDGKRGFVLTLTAREQHIRREKATSNICSNQGLMALASTIYMSLLGKQGLHRVSEICYHRAHYAAEKLKKNKKYKVHTSQPFFHEFMVETAKPLAHINAHLLEHGILGGYDLEQDYPALKNHMLLAVTEMNSKEEIDYLIDVLEEIGNE